jgi:GT2 family glycosyltransferase
MAPQVSLRAAVLNHRNDYGFDANAPPALVRAPSVACVIRYHETGLLASQVAASLLASLRNYRHSVGTSDTNCRLIVVDDGSRLRTFQAPSGPQDIKLQVVHLESNQGRSRARNAGLHAASASDAEVTVFVDSDVLVPSDHVTNLVSAMQPTGHAIAAGFFMTARCAEGKSMEQALGRARDENDWRSECVYEPSWIGCPADIEFVGRRFRLLRETQDWRKWSGMVGPWCLANMVLGGCFAVPTDLAASVGGFEESFDRYGFTETTLIAKIIAAGCMVVPVLGSTAVHVESQPAHLSQSQRNVHFREAHHRFFGEFLAGPA